MLTLLIIVVLCPIVVPWPIKQLDPIELPLFILTLFSKTVKGPIVTFFSIVTFLPITTESWTPLCVAVSTLKCLRTLIKASLGFLTIMPSFLMKSFFVAIIADALEDVR